MFTTNKPNISNQSISKRFTSPGIEKLQHIWEEGTLHKTTDYNIFQFVNSNREVKIKDVTHLANKILEKNLLMSNPINVKHAKNGKLDIMEGQHRLSAVKLIHEWTGQRLPLYFIVDNNFEVNDIASINSTRKKWAPIDYVEHFIKEGKEDYKILKDFSKRYGISINNAIGLLSGRTSNPNTSLIKQFQTGEFVASDLDHATKVMNMLKDFQKYDIKSFASKTFLSVLSKVVLLVNYDHKLVKEKLADRYRLFRGCVTINDYIETWDKFYNDKNNSEKIDFNII